MTEMITEKMTETKRGLHIPESYVFITKSGYLRLHLPAFPGDVTVSDPDR